MEPVTTAGDGLVDLTTGGLLVPEVQQAMRHLVGQVRGGQIAHPWGLVVVVGSG
jgi:hypothetical protein